MTNTRGGGGHRIGQRYRVETQEEGLGDDFIIEDVAIVMAQGSPSGTLGHGGGGVNHGGVFFLLQQQLHINLYM